MTDREHPSRSSGCVSRSASRMHTGSPVSSNAAVRAAKLIVGGEQRPPWRQRQPRWAPVRRRQRRTAWNVYTWRGRKRHRPPAR